MRVNITTDGELVGWFNPDAATAWDEATRWDGQNRVSVNPVGQYGHQVLYRTAGGRWVRHTWSQWQGSEPRYEFVEPATAREWLLLNDEDDAARGHFGEIEDERGPDPRPPLRPEVGNLIHVRLGELLPRVDAWAAEQGVSRAEAVRRLLAGALADQASMETASPVNRQEVWDIIATRIRDDAPTDDIIDALVAHGCIRLDSRKTH